MEDSDRQHVGEVIREFAAVKRVPFNSLTAKFYWEALRDMSRSTFDDAAQHLRQYSKWMPQPGDFRAAARRGWS